MMLTKKLFFLAGFLLPFGWLTAGNPADITVYNFDSFEYRLHKDTDTIYVVNFWATWCAPCVKEIPDFEKLQATYKNDKVKVLFVSLDFPGQVQSRVIPFMERMNMQAEVLLLNDPKDRKSVV